MTQRTKSGANRAFVSVKTSSPKCIAPIPGSASIGTRWTAVSRRLLPSNALRASALEELALDVRGVGQPRGEPKDPLPRVRGTEARSAGIDRRDGVTRVLQIKEYAIEPSESVLARNLLAKEY